MQAISHSSVVCMRLKQMMWPGKRRLVNNIPLFSIFIFQTLSDKQLLPEHNHNQCSFWETYLTTSDLEHKGHIHFNYLLCLRKLFRKSFHFCFFLKFWTQIEEYFLRTRYSSLKVPPRTDGLCPHSPAFDSYPVLAAIPSPLVLTCSWQDLQWWR